MIRLTRPQKPVELTVAKQKELTDKFIADKGKTVWKQEWIKKPLMEMSYDKCAFSEMKLDEEGKYMQVEHFHPKSRYPEEVVEWENLLPICNFCNTAKGEFDTKTNPLVNPSVDDPKDYFYIKRGRLWAKDRNNKKAQLTIDKYQLNDYQQLTKVRRNIELDLDERLKDISRSFEIDFDNGCIKLRNLLKRCNRRASYSAVRATFILSNAVYHQLKNILVKRSLWDKRFQTYEKEMLFCALPKE